MADSTITIKKSHKNIPKIELHNPIYYELFIGIFQFLDGNEIQKSQLVCRSWDSFITKYIGKLPLLLVPYVRLIHGEFCFETQKFEVDEQAKNKDSKFKLKILPNSQNYIIDKFQLSKYPYAETQTREKTTNTRPDNQLKKKESDNRRKILSSLSDLKLQVLNLEAEFEYSEETPTLINRLNEMLCTFIVKHLDLKIRNIHYEIDYVSLQLFPDDFDPKNFTAIENLPRYKEISITWNYTMGTIEESRRLIEWMSSPHWARNRVKKSITFKNSFQITGFMEAYIKFFLETKTPNTMFKNVLIRTDAFYEYGPGPSPHGCANEYCGIPQTLPFSIPRDFCLENNIIGRIYQIENDEDDVNYKMLIETDEWSKGFAKELFEIKREDGYILRIISDIGDNDDESESLTFTIHHKDCPPKEFVPNWAAFPLPQDQLGFDYVDMYGNLLEC